ELRTRLNNLALDQSARDQVKALLDGLDKSEADQVGAMRNRDQQTLAQLRAQLRSQAQNDVNSGVAKIRAQNSAKLDVQGGVTGTVPGAAPASGNLPPDLKAKIAALHKEYQDRYARDAKATIAQFNKTRDDLQKRYNELHAVDSGASTSLRKELASLQAQHDQLYSEIVDQINREVRIVAQEKGVSTVISGVLGDGSGVDLTQAAKKEIESLHE
ncbi:MAG: OmpH family outer membrane protein, partial [Vulcanimicrobiaceae bacterium]